MHNLLNSSKTLGFKFQLLCKTKRFEVYRLPKSIQDFQGIEAAACGELKVS
jgi:hypothetical protein